MVPVYTENATICYHCGETGWKEGFFFDEKYFCCAGCKTVYDILNKNGLCNYYQLNISPGQNQRSIVRPEKFAFLEDAQLSEQLIKYRNGQYVQVCFYLPQVHCSSCLWLLENLHQMHNGISNSRVDFAHKEVTLQFNEKEISLKQVAELLTGIGYEPYISLHDLNKKPKKYYNKHRIYRLGVAGFCLGNIMLLSFPEYLSVVDNPEQVQLTPWFRYLSLLLAIPVFFFSAQEFFIQGWKGLRSGFLNIDAPIALAIFICFVRSIYEITTQTGPGYLDSMAGIVFFMLIGRILQDRTQQSLTFDRDYTSYFPIAVHKIVDGKELPAALPNLRAGDRVAIHAQEIIPADGLLLRGDAEIDYSFVTGESVPVPKAISELIYAGGRQVGGKIELLLVKDVSQSYLTRLWNQSSKGKDTDHRDSFLHPLARYFTAILFTLTAIAGIYWWFADPAQLWPVVTAMLIVACPCALLLSATFTNGHVVRAFDRAGFFLRDFSILEKLLPITHIVFDKTGTITNNHIFDITHSGDPLTNAQRQLLSKVALQSNHPLSRAVGEWLGGQNDLLDNFRETPGKGMEAWVEDTYIKMGSPEFVWGTALKTVKGSIVAYKIDSQKEGFFMLRNHYRKGVFQSLKKLSKRYRLAVVSGDNDSEKETLQSLLGSDAILLFNQSPHDKLAFIKDLQQKGAKVLMIGDGLNDAAALSQSDVGIAVTDQVNNFSPACDGILEASKLQRLNGYLLMASSGRRIILFSFIISILYNLIGLSFAASGTLTPLVAAILMPSSSISIILITWLGVQLRGSVLLGNSFRVV